MCQKARAAVLRFLNGFHALTLSALAGVPLPCAEWLFWAARYTVATPRPSSFAIADQEAPEARRLAIFDSLANVRGRPKRLPLARAFRNPAFTRSWIKARSNSAMAPMI